jgi:hypothetical protein
MAQVFENERREADSRSENSLWKQAVWRLEPLFFSDFLQLALPKIELFHGLIGQAFLPV